MNNIFKVNPGLPTTTKISLINDQVITVAGQTAKTKFDRYELDSLYSNLGVIRQYYRDVALGNTLLTYTGWSCLSVQTGYNIWKFTPANYSYNALNAVYWNDALLTNMGLATSEAVTEFDKVFYNLSTTWVDDTVEAGTGSGSPFNLLSSTTDYVYFGLSSVFGGIAFTIPTRASGITLVVEYYNAESGTGWRALNPITDNLDDETNGLSGNGAITFNIPVDWVTHSVNSVSKYWIRISSTSIPVTVGMCSLAIPSASVIALLSLSSSQVINEEWEFCSYNGNIYVTIPNIGNSPAEGTNFITSISTATNLKNFFIYNNEFTANYASSLYTPSSAGITKYIYSFTNASLQSGGFLVLTHSAVSRFVQVSIYDNNGTLVNPDSISLTNTTTVRIGLTSYMSLTGTWTAIII